MKDKVSEEVALTEFNRFADEMDLDIDESEMTEEELKDFLPEKAKIIKAMKNGSLIVNEAGEPVFSPTKSDIPPIVFHEPTGASLVAMDKKKKNEDISKFYTVLGDITKTSASTFAKLKMRDLKVCIAIGTLFLA